MENERHYAILRGIAAGIRAAVGKSQLISFHPVGQQHSSQYFHHDDWLDFNMVQSGHIQNNENWKFITKDYNLKPVKPCMDGEPGYENIASRFDPKNGFLSAHDVRKFAYWALFAGAHGHTYGCNEVWQSKWTKSQVLRRWRGGTTRAPARRNASVFSQPEASNSLFHHLHPTAATGCWWWMSRHASSRNRVSKPRGGICYSPTGQKAGLRTSRNNLDTLGGTGGLARASPSPSMNNYSL